MLPWRTIDPWPFDRERHEFEKARQISCRAARFGARAARFGARLETLKKHLSERPEPNILDMASVFIIRICYL
jgi:hypothetical protein